MDLNPVFVDAHGFRPQMRNDLDGGEGLELFSHANIPLVHGWLVDPLSPEYEAVQMAGDYDNSVNVVAEADHLTQGRLVVDVDGDEAGGSSNGTGNSSHTEKQSDVWTTEQRTKVEDGIFLSLQASLPLIHVTRSYLHSPLPQFNSIPTNLPWPLPSRLCTLPRHPLSPLQGISSFRHIQIRANGTAPGSYLVHPRHRSIFPARILSCVGKVWRRGWAGGGVCGFRFH